MKADDFEVIPPTRGVVEPKKKNTPDISGKEHMLHAVADNFGRILDVASSIVEIEKINVQANAYISELEEKRKMLVEETDAYVRKLEADTNSTVSKIEVIRQMMKDYYESGQKTLSGEEFSKVITDILNRMGDL